MVSESVKASTHGQNLSAVRKLPWRRAQGSSNSVAGAVRRNTSAGGETSATATRISRYGIPQMTHRERKSNQPLRDTDRSLLATL